MTLSEYCYVERAKVNEHWSTFFSSDNPGHEERYEQYDSYLYRNEEFFKHIDEYDEDVFIETIISLYKYYYPSENRFYWTVYMSKNTPGIGNGRFKFDQTLPENVELTVDYIISLRKTFNI